MKYKKIISIILVVVMSVFLFAGCGAFDEELVRGTATEFAEAFFVKNDPYRAREYCKSSARNFVDDNASFYCDKPADVAAIYEIEDIDMDGDEATVRLYLRFERDERHLGSYGFNLEMKKYDNDWKIYRIQERR